ncbi:related to dihydrodipicolinate synthase [Ramularia collo-cygni]|uniref:Related to dihydrodipicolinate synthase n=1 Tax=Ramularia collo-cygni TaxID=112498 RepID=A0A2D3VF23_9PEZI|nr:related to dihydrodipicolinate synthase [Ramularia collo-cygni]CZT21454.1 related to dihydrodipicolinate synthase [Ramularia collo-cygni]
MPSNEYGGSNGNVSAYPPGIHVPSLTFFDSSPRQEIDWHTQRRHLAFLVKSGIHGIVLAGTNGEAVTLTRTEKTRLTVLAREVAHEHGRSDLPITVGTNPSGSTRDVIDDCVAAKEANADYVLVLVPAFFHFAMSKDAICGFFEEVAENSPLPLLLYNFPGVAAGLNLDSPMLDRLARHKNIVGVKVSVVEDANGHQEY